MKELNEFLVFKKIPNKVILFTDRKEPGLLYKGLTGLFRDRLDFGEVYKSAGEIIVKYEVKEYPTLMVLKYDENKDKFSPIFY